MLSRRFLAGLTLNVDGLGVANVDCRTPSVTRNVINQIDTPDGRSATMQVLVDIDAHATVSPHAHPSVESVYILEGGGILQINGQPDRVMRPGDTAEVPPNTPHALRNGARPTKLLSIYMVDTRRELAAAAL